MSADASYNILQSHADGHVALPQPIGDLSLIDSVTGFIQEVIKKKKKTKTNMNTGSLLLTGVNLKIRYMKFGLITLIQSQCAECATASY